MREMVQKNWPRVFKFFLWVLLLLFVLVLISVLVIFNESNHSIYESVDVVPSAQVALIPGAAILPGGGLSPVLADRVDMAIKLYKAEKVKKILVTGDNSTLAYNEVNPVRLYLLANSIPDSAIFLDHAGFDTYSSMYRARDIFLTDSIIIVTQGFHLPRAVYIAQELGINAAGLKADNGHYLLRNYIRETLADVKAVIDLTTKRKPKFLGKEIPIMGDNKKQ